MNDLPLSHHESYYLSQLSVLEIPYGYDHRKAIGDKEILFYINCRDGVKIIYVNPDCLFPTYDFIPEETQESQEVGN